MFETPTSCIEHREGGPRAAALAGAAARFCAGLLAGAAAVLLPPVLAQVSQGHENIFPPAPYFLLALGVGLFIGTVIVAITAART